MPSENQTYLIDTDVLARINVRRDARHIYRGLIAMAHAGTLRSVHQVFEELKKFKPEFEILKAHRDEFQLSSEEQYTTGVQGFIEILGNEASYLWEQTGGRNPDLADPWLVAVAATYG